MSTRNRALIASMVCGVLLSACMAAPAVPTPTPTPTPPRLIDTAPVSSIDYGIHMFIWGQPATTQRDLTMASDAGFRWQKSLFQWREIEGKAKGQFDWTESDRVVRASTAMSIRIIARLDFEPLWARRDQAHNGPPDNYQDYWDFVAQFASRYATGSSIGRVYAIEVWNEPNLDREWGNQTINQDSAADYVRLLGGAYLAAHAADPNMVVISAGLSPTGVTDGHSADDLEYLNWMYRAGLKGKFDVLGAHANTQAPEVAAPFGSLKDFPHPSFYFRRVEQLRQAMIENGDAQRQIWLVEWGWTADRVHPAYSWFAVTEDKKAENIVAGLQYARDHWTPWMGVMVLWTFSDPTWDQDREEYWWAITNPDGTPRAAYTQVRNARQTGVLR
jgi:polysaccharide biosynthesis protein PslG